MAGPLEELQALAPFGVGGLEDLDPGDPLVEQIQELAPCVQGAALGPLDLAAQHPNHPAGDRHDQEHHDHQSPVEHQTEHEHAGSLQRLGEHLLEEDLHADLDDAGVAGDAAHRVASLLLAEPGHGQLHHVAEHIAPHVQLGALDHDTHRVLVPELADSAERGHHQQTANHPHQGAEPCGEVASCRKLAGHPQRHRAVNLGILGHNRQGHDVLGLGLDHPQLSRLAVRQGSHHGQQLVVRTPLAVDLDDAVALADISQLHRAGLAVLMDLDVLDLDAGIEAAGLRRGRPLQVALRAVFQHGYIDGDLGTQTVFSRGAVEPVGQRLVLVEHHLQQRQDRGDAHGVEEGHAQDSDEHHRKPAFLRPDVS